MTMTSDEPLATIIAVHYGPPEPTRAFVHALADLPGRERLRLILVDQSGTLEPVEYPPRVCEHLLRPARNLGYLGGIGFAITGSLENAVSLGRWVAGSNTDVRLAPDFVETLAGLQIDSERPVAIVGPRIVEPGRGDVNPFLRVRPSALRILAQAVLFGVSPLARAYTALHHVRRRATSKRSAVASAEGKAERIYAAHGSFFLMERGFAERQASHGYPSFLYGEEIHLAECAGAWKRSVWHVPALGVTHAMGEATRGVAVRQRNRWRSQSRRVLWRMHFAPHWLRGPRGGAGTSGDGDDGNGDEA